MSMQRKASLLSAFSVLLFHFGTVQVFGQTKKESVPVLGLISNSASEAIKDLSEECRSKGVNAIQAKFDALPDADKQSVDGQILLASLEQAANKKDQAIERVGKLADAKLAPGQGETLATFLLQAQKDHKSIEPMLLNARKLTPDSPLVDYRLAQYYARNAKYEDAIKMAESTKEKFSAKGDQPAWLMLESIDCAGVRIDVHYNCGPRELNPPEFGIVKPMSFRIWSTDKSHKLLEVIDFEKGMSQGKAVTAALGQATKRGHSNFGMLDVDAKYEDVRAKLIKLVESRHSKKNGAKKPKEEEKDED